MEEKEQVKYSSIRILKEDFKRLEIRKALTDVPIVHIVAKALDALDQNSPIKTRRK